MSSRTETSALQNAPGSSNQTRRKRKLKVSMAFVGKEAFVTASFRRMTGKRRLHLFKKQIKVEEEERASGDRF